MTYRLETEEEEWDEMRVNSQLLTQVHVLSGEDGMRSSDERLKKKLIKFTYALETDEG